MHINFAALTAQLAYFTMNATLIPRPIAWVLSENVDGGLNIAPYSYFNAISSNPPLLMISAGMTPDGTSKDTHNNIRDRNDLVVHIVSLEQVKEMNQSSETHPPGVLEV